MQCIFGGKYVCPSCRYVPTTKVYFFVLFPTSPTPVVSWIHSNVPLVELAGKREFSRNNTVLTINSVTSADSGQYVCRAQNERGIDEAEMTLGLGVF